MEWTKMMDSLSDCSSAMMLTISWNNGSIIKGIVDTISETNNNLDEADENYKEYYMCVIEIKEVVFRPDDYNRTFGELDEGNFIEISLYNQPDEIKDEFGNIVWAKNTY